MWKCVEYDRYLRPVIDLGHCHFKGGKGGSETTTKREIPDQTAEEKQLQDYLMDWSTTAGDSAKYALQRAGVFENQVFNPNWGDMYREYVRREDNLANEYQAELADALSGYQGATDRYSRQMQGAKNSFDQASSSALSDYANKENQYLNQYADSAANHLGQYEGNAAKHLGQYEGNAANHLGQYEGAMDSAKANYDTATGARASAWEDLLAGNLPSAYATNRQAALNTDLRGTMGSAVNSLANRGVINSSVSNKAMDDISQSASDTLAKMYNTDINTYASLLGQDASNIKQAYDVASGNAGSVYGAQSGADSSMYGAQSAADSNIYGAQSAADSTLYGNQTGSARNVFGNQYQTAQGQFDNAANAYGSTMGQLADMYQTKVGATGDKFSNLSNQYNDLLNGGIISQTASYEPMTNYLNYASQLSAPASNLFNTLYSGRMGTGSTTTTQSSGNSGVWSAIGSLGSMALLCFTGETLVTTPEGYVELANVSEGDTVLSVHDGEIVPKQVVKVYGPETKEVIDVYFDNGTVWHTTKGQRYYDGKHFVYVDFGGTPAMVCGGHPSRIVSVQSTGKMAAVYDIKLEGFAGENVWFANDVAAEGFGD